MGKILIEGMEFYAYHGCFAEEQIIGTRFMADLEIETDTVPAEKSDQLSQTINYQEVYKVIAGQMAVKSKLLEHVAGRIVQELKAQYPSIIKMKLKISKLDPHLGGKVAGVSILVESKGQAGEFSE